MIKERHAPGAFVVSLDFELLWGVLDHANEDTYGSHVLGARTVIPEILALFREYGIHATWGVVGLIYHEDRAGMMAALPACEPTYQDPRLSAYRYMAAIRERNRDYYFAPELIRLIQEEKGQEIASHTYSHYYCCEDGQTVEQFRHDLGMAVKTARENGDELCSIIFPRNQHNPAYEDVLKAYGIRAFRGNEKGWCYAPGADRRGIKRLPVRVVRFADSYINLCGNHCYPYEELGKNGLLNIRSSRFLRPYSQKLSVLERLKLHRIKKQMSYAAMRGEIFHMWWHPHNFGTEMEANLSNLRKLLEHYLSLHREYGFLSMNMREVSQYHEDRNHGKQR